MKLRDMASVYRRQRVSDGHGGGTENWIPLGTVRVQASQTAPQGGSVLDSQNWLVRFRATEPIQEKDRLVIDDIVLEVGKIQRLRQGRGYVKSDCLEIQDWRLLQQ